jgi:predicted Zn-dependent protease
MSLEAIAEKLLAEVKERAKDAEAQVHVSDGRTKNVRFAAGEITTSGDADAGGVTLTVALGQRHATASTNRTDAEALSALAERALGMARLAPEDPEWVGVLGAQTYGPAGATFDADTESLGFDARAKDLAATLARCDAAKVLGSGFHVTSASRLLLASSAGLRATHRSTEAELTMTARTPDGTGSGWAGAQAVRAADVDAAKVSAVAIDKALRSAKPRALPPGRYDVVLEPPCVAELLGFLLGALDARAADEGRSFFSKKGGGTKLGETLFPEHVTFTSDPQDPATPAAPFDDEGVPLARTAWIDAGTVRALGTSRYWAKKTGRAPTGSHRTAHLAGGQADGVEALVKKVRRGLLVTRFWYTRWLDPQTVKITGLTRDGVWLVENGELAYPVNNFRFNESPVRMLAECTDLAKRAERVAGQEGVWCVPALLARGFEMASVSRAV